MRFAVDTGGTFTDLVVEDDDGALSLHKSSTTPADPVEGVLNVLAKAAERRGVSREELLAQGEMLIHGTTRAINAILTGNTAKTAFVTTQGHPDILLFREGGRSDPFNFTRPYPEPYVPRALTYEVPGRIGSQGEEVESLDEATVARIAVQMREAGVEAVGVCLLWAMVNPKHELRVGELFREALPGVPVTLSHQLNPTIREYRRASSVCIDASLKPLMTSYLGSLEERLRAAGFAGRLLMVTSSGGVLDASAVAKAPIHAINSGPSMAPVAGGHYASLDAGTDTAVIADTGGTSYDVSLVRRGGIPLTRETWLGDPFFGHLTGFPSVDVKSIGAGGGSIAWVDDGGLLHVGPESAGADPGPVCYARGGTRPTVTDACLILGYLDPDNFLGGDMRLDAAGAADAIDTQVARPLGLELHDAAASILELATEHMIHAIEDITVNQGIDPREAVLVGGGGAAGLNSVAIARRLSCPQVLVPQTGAALSAAGALLSDLTATYSETFTTTVGRFDRDGVNAVLDRLEDRCREFIATAGGGTSEAVIDFWAEARYPQQVWQLDVPLDIRSFANDADVAGLESAFHRVHDDVFAINDEESDVEVIAWHARARCRLREHEVDKAVTIDDAAELPTREVHFAEHGKVETKVIRLETMPIDAVVEGPAIVESSFTTIVIDPGASGTRTSSGTLSIMPESALAGAATAEFSTESKE